MTGLRRQKGFKPIELGAINGIKPFRGFGEDISDFVGDGGGGFFAFILVGNIHILGRRSKMLNVWQRQDPAKCIRAGDLDQTQLRYPPQPQRILWGATIRRGKLSVFRDADLFKLNLEIGNKNGMNGAGFCPGR